jgi:hypothetical protein
MQTKSICSANQGMLYLVWATLQKQVLHKYYHGLVTRHGVWIDSWICSVLITQLQIIITHTLQIISSICLLVAVPKIATQDFTLVTASSDLWVLTHDLLTFPSSPWHGPHRKHCLQQFLCFCMFICCCRHMFITLLPSSGSLYSCFKLACHSMYEFSIVVRLPAVCWKQNLMTL